MFAHDAKALAELDEVYGKHDEWCCRNLMDHQVLSSRAYQWKIADAMQDDSAIKILSSLKSSIQVTTGSFQICLFPSCR